MKLKRLLGVPMFADLSEQQVDWLDKDQTEYLAERLDKLELDNEFSCEYYMSFFLLLLRRISLTICLAGATDDEVTQIEAGKEDDEKG